MTCRCVTAVFFCTSLFACSARNGTGSGNAFTIDADTPRPSPAEAGVRDQRSPRDDVHADTVVASDVPEIVCEPGQETCSAGVATVCATDGRSVHTYACDPLQGLTCTATGCSGPCSPSSLGTGYSGCDFFPTVTANPVHSAFHFAIGVVGTREGDTNVVVTQGTRTIATRTIHGRAIEIIELPWVRELKGGDYTAPTYRIPELPNSMLVREGAYRVRSTLPISVYQFNALEYQLPDVTDPSCPDDSLNPSPGSMGDTCTSYSNDASLLFPANALGSDYETLGWPSATSGGMATVTVTAVENGTVVDVTGPPGPQPDFVTPYGPVRAGGGVDRAGDGRVTMSAGDVLEIIATGFAPVSSDNSLFYAPGVDLSGTRIRSNKNVQVIVGNSCANVPLDGPYCDHLEDFALPAHALGQEYVLVNFAPQREGARQAYTIRVGGGAGTTVRFEPPIASPVTFGPERPYLQISGIRDNVRLVSDRPFNVVQYMQGGTTTDPVRAAPIADPAMAYGVPTRQFRTDYGFYAATSYQTNFVNVVAPIGATIMLDGTPVDVASFSRVGTSDFVAGYVPLTDTGAHRMTGSLPFGILIYGYGYQTSYAYPGGLNLGQ